MQDLSNIFAITVNSLNCWAGNSKKIQLLHNVSFKVPAGKLTTFVGHNGAGKTTTVKSILGLRTNVDGTIIIQGVPARNVISRANIGYVPEKGNIEHKSALDFLKQIGHMRGMETPQIMQETTDFLNFFHLSNNILKINMNKLSSGQNKIICLCQAFFNKPQLIIADEPTDNLDPETRDLFWDYVAKFRKENPTSSFFVITHNLDEIEKYTDYLVFLHRGKMMLECKYNRAPGLRKKYRVLRKKWETHINKITPQN